MWGIKGLKQPQTTRELWQANSKEWVDGARQTARILLRRRPFVTIDDVLEEYPFPEYLNWNIKGSVFKHPDFEHAGYTKSRRPVSKGNILHQWKLKEV